MKDPQAAPISLPLHNLSKAAQDKLAKLNLSDGQVMMISLLADIAVDRHVKGLADLGQAEEDAGQ